MLPQELVEGIIDHVADEDLHSLKAFSSVSRAWLSRCRFHLFKSCILHTKDSWGANSSAKDNVLSFGDLLRSPYCTFLPYLCTIHAVRRSVDAFDGHFQEIAPDLRRLTAVVELVMVAFIDPMHATTPSFFGRTGFFMAFPHLEKLLLNYIFMNDDLGRRTPSPITDLISLFPDLQELNINTVGGEFAEPSADAVPPQQLRSLVLRGITVSPILAWLRTSNSLHRINSLMLNREQDVTTTRVALKQIGNALHHLDIDQEGLPLVVDFSLHSNLKTLVIRWWDMTHAVMTGLIPSLADLPLERLWFDIDVESFRTFDWTMVDLFLSPARFPCLWDVKFRCKRDAEADFVRQRLPLLQAAGRLDTGYNINMY
ncbi:hypothetical protein C8R45DRAFT_1215251 [Mycena sanguinolenta]|nr:hypothetical protein C8R45DRAFT_1215251 [Mycena sanguinolenta]